MSAPPINKRILTTGIAKVTLPNMPAMPKQSEAASMKMAGVGGAGVGLPSAISGKEGSSAGGGPISFFGLREIGACFKDFIAPQTLYASQIFMPKMSAEEGPKAFHVSGEVKPRLWVALYQGRVSPPETGTYHFVGAGDDLLLVRFNGQVVLDGSWNPHSDSRIVAKYDYGDPFDKLPNKFVKGPAVSVTVGNFYDMEILIGEQPALISLPNFSLKKMVRLIRRTATAARFCRSFACSMRRFRR